MEREYHNSYYIRVKKRLKKLVMAMWSKRPDITYLTELFLNYNI